MPAKNEHDEKVKVVETLDGRKLENKDEIDVRFLAKEEQKDIGALKLEFKIPSTKNVNEQANQYYTTNESLQQIERDFDIYLQDLANERGISLNKLKEQGYKAEYNKEGTTLMLSFPNSQDSKNFINQLFAQNKIKGPFQAHHDQHNQRSNLPPPTPPGAVVKDEEAAQNHRRFSPFHDLGKTPKLERR